MNRYTQLSYSNFDLPMLQLPFEQLNELVGSFQKSKDEFDALSELVPKYIKDSKSDTELVGQIKSYQNQVVNQLADVAATGDVSEYRRQLTEAKKAIANMWKPGGAANALEQRYDQEQARIKEVTEFFKDNKLLQERFKKDYAYNNIEYDPDTGGFKSLGGQQYYKHYTEADINKWATDNIDKLKAEYLGEGYDVRALNDVTDLHSFIKKTGVTRERIQQIMLKTLPTEFIQSMYQDAATQKYFNPNAPDINPEVMSTVETKDKNGKIIKKQVLNLDNPVGKFISGIMDRAYTEIDVDRLQVKDDIELERRKIKMQKDADAPNYIPRELEIVNMPGGGIPELKFNLDDNGFIVEISPALRQRNSPYDMGLSTIENKTSKDKAIDLFRNGTLAKQIPEAGQVYERFKNEPWFKKLSDKAKAEYLIEATNQSTKLTRTTNIKANFYQDEKTINEKTNVIIGSKNALGEIKNRQIIMLDKNNTVISGPNNIQSIIEEYFAGDVEKFIASSKVKADIRGDNAFMPSGDYIDITYIDGKKVNTITVLATQDDPYQTSVRSTIFKGNSVLYGNYNTSVPFKTGIPRVDERWPEGIQTKRVTIYLDQDVDNMANQVLQTYQKNGYYIDPNGVRITNSNVIDQIVNQYKSEAERLRKSPKENTARNEIYVQNPVDGKLIGDSNFWREITQATETEAANYEFNR